ncbi:hypothetical protein EVJ58_g1926 [Rhodofomes roseus]|uniref:Uncharacterized protein n=1 Tax=Rhodofomes roseus TaxID=34475 RepID=A0A4Y9YSW3_9APHY|nr:hypothetical protein EVJ58_g1926 [Rhodofomes roseus]
MAGEPEAQTTAVVDLIPLRQMLLLARRRGVGWEQLESALVHVEIVGEAGDVDWVDVDGEWARQCGVGEEGAVLVRPDGIVLVAWRGGWNDDFKDVAKWGRVLERVMYLAP